MSDSNKKAEFGIMIYDFDDSKPIEKSENQTVIDPETHKVSDIWLYHNSSFGKDYKAIIDNSAILPQCINAYARNIAGFGLGVRYKTDYKGKETPQMMAEYDRVETLLDLLTLEKDTKNIFEQMIKDVESTGISYLEIIRDNNGLPVEAVNVTAVDTIIKSKKIEPVEVDYHYGDNKIFKRKKTFRKYKQEIDGQVVYLKEFGDPRVMDNRNGEYIDNAASLSDKYVANEILEFRNDESKPYGDVRWIGCMHSIVGAHHAESLNLNYFKNGRHTPLAICIENGTLTEEAKIKLRDYTNAIRGESAQHAFLILETEPLQGDLNWSKENPPKVTLKELGSVLQKDELFGEYIEKNRRKVQSAFNLPDIYVGYTTDFNRATAYAAMSVTEDQVFKPYRRSLEWLINNKLFNEYAFQYCEVYFKSPDLTSVDDIVSILNATGVLGGVPLNLAKEIVYNLLGKDCEDYNIDNADLPLSLINSQQSISQQISTQIKKAENNEDYDIVPVLKSLLKEFKRMKLNETDTEIH